MSEYVFAVMTKAMFHPNYGGKLSPGDIIECTKEDAIRMRRVNVAKPASKAQVSEWKAKRENDEPDDIETEDYITSGREDETDEDVANSFDEGVDEEEDDEEDSENYDEKKQ